MKTISRALLIIFFIAGIAFAMDNGSGQSPEALYPDWLAPSPYSYSPEKMSDPFVPFVRPEIQEEVIVELERPQRPLTPLEKVEIGQLRLVGIIWGADSSHDPSAMVELPDGKGFILNVGTVVGRNLGQVEAIMPSEVLILEEVTNIFGATREKRTTLKLRPGQED